MIEYLKPGEKIGVAAPAATGGYGEHAASKQQHSLAAGAGVMYEQMTGDLSLVNYFELPGGQPRNSAPMWERTGRKL